jgi:dipeptidyl-peptidase 4
MPARFHLPLAILHSLAMLLCTSTPLTARPVDDDALRTVAEASDFTRTATHAEVMALIDRLLETGPHLRRGTLGTSVEGRDLPLLIAARPPVETAVAARALGKPIIFAFGNIHAGEVCGKEALLMLARELALDPGHPMLDDLTLVLAPIFNADGNDRMNPDNRPGQNGPEEMGQRPNAQGLDLNRDFVKLESPEARGLVAFLTEWDPHLTIDCHTTNGSHHQYTLTFEAPTNPSGPAAPIEFVRDTLLPEVAERLEARTGYKTFFYGNFNHEMNVWGTYSALPRFGGPYQGLRGQMSILSEAHSYAPFEDRVRCTLEFVREICTFAAEETDTILTLHARARARVTAAGLQPQPDDLIGIRHTWAAFPRPITIEGWVMEPRERGRPRPTEVPRDYDVLHLGRFEATRCVARPHGYILLPGLESVVEKLRQHGIIVEPITGNGRFEQYRIDDIARRTRPFQGHHLVTVEATATPIRRALPPGSTFVTCAQPLGTLAAYLLEPESEDGLVAWNFFDGILAPGEPYPVWRLRHPSDLDGRTERIDDP